MVEIGIRKLKTHASEIIRTLREQQTRYVITYRGRPVGLLLPLTETDQTYLPATTADPWAELTQLGQEIAQGWPPGQTGADILSDMRR